MDRDKEEELTSLHGSESVCFRISFTDKTLGFKSLSIPNFISEGGLLRGDFSENGMDRYGLSRSSLLLLEDDDDEIVVPDEKDEGEQNDFGDERSAEEEEDDGGEEATDVGEERGPKGGGRSGRSSFHDLRG